MKRNQREPRKSRSIALALLATAVLAACGGDDEGPSTPAVTAGTPSGPAPTEPVSKPASSVTPACTACGAIDANTYSGSGVGIWQNINATTAVVDMPISISGLNGQDVTLVFTNETGTPQVMPTLPLTSSYYPSVVASELQWDDGSEAIKRRIQAFNRTGWAALAGERGAASSYSQLSAPNRSAVNDVRSWFHADDSERTATLVRQGTTTDGTTVNFWVENGESDPAKVSPAIIDTLVDGFVPSGKIYDLLESVGGPLWGVHSYSDLIDGNGQPIDIVILNFDRNAKPNGVLGYFYALNAFKRDTTKRRFSNESISLYLDAETLYLGGASGLHSMLLTMAHEGMHMQNFYRRTVTRGATYAFDTWLEEATAMMMEDFASQAVEPTYNAIRDVRFPNYIGYRAGSYNCSLVDWMPFGRLCDSYSVTGSFGGFLDRQLGLDFYRGLLTNVSSADSVVVLDAAIRAAAPTSSLGEQLRRFAATAGSLMKAPSPAGFGFPSRGASPFMLPSIDPQAQLKHHTLTQSVPTMLQPYASLPVVRQAIKGTYSETVKVPAGTALSVVIQ